MKHKKMCIITVCLLLLMCLIAVGSYLYGRHTAFVGVARAYYEAHGDRELIRQFRFPFPFLKQKIEKERWQDRRQIHAAISGYTQFRTKTGTLGERSDIYVFEMPPFGEAVIYITYDVTGKLKRIDEFGPAILLSTSE